MGHIFYPSKSFPALQNLLRLSLLRYGYFQNVFLLFDPQLGVRVMWIINTFLELGTQQHCINNVTMFSGRDPNIFGIFFLSR